MVQEILMKIVKHGTIKILLTDEKMDCKVEGWICEPEADDPKDATGEQLLLWTVIRWARKRFDEEVNKAIIQAKVAQMRKGN
jgi:hypothetical protein